ncbi:MAG: solute-binding protein, partial [Actinobacteria bacterium]|nr:solute-binding protein [Actinomycetota bacterium]
TAIEIGDPPGTIYVAATLGESADPGLAARFIDFVLSPQGQTILARHGFGSAP